MIDLISCIGIVYFIECQLIVSGFEMLVSLVLLLQFDFVIFESYWVDFVYLFQEDVKQMFMCFVGCGIFVKCGGLFSWVKKELEFKLGVYFDGGFGVGKIYLFVLIYYVMFVCWKYFGLFIEYMVFVGVFGYKNMVDFLKGVDLFCIDEFEFDDLGDIMVMI